MFSSKSNTTCLIGVVVHAGDSAAVSDVRAWFPPQLGTAASASAPTATADAAIIAGLRLFHFPVPICPPEECTAPVLRRIPGLSMSSRIPSGRIDGHADGR